MGMAVGGKGGIKAEINVTPMVDVLLCLLIIFMVASPKPPNEKMTINVPKNAVTQAPSDPSATLLVTVDANGNAKLGQDPLPRDFDGMVAAFQKNEKAQTDGRLAIKGEDKAKYGEVIRIMTAAHQAGIAKVGIASEKL